MRLNVVAIAVVVLVSGCKDKSSPPPSPSPSVASGDTPPPPAAAVGIGSGSGGSLDDVMGKIMIALAKEKDQRPNPGPTVEDVFARLASNPELTPETIKQFLGAPVGARYCAGGPSKTRLSVTVCEYASDDEAAAGRAFVMKQYAQVNDHRVIVVKGASTITVTGATTAEIQSRVGPALDAL